MSLFEILSHRSPISERICLHLDLDDILRLKMVLRLSALDCTFRILDINGTFMHQFPSLTPDNIKRYRNIQGQWGSLLMRCIGEGNVEKARSLIANPVLPINFRESKQYNQTPLIYAVKAMQIRIVELLLTRKDIDVNFQNNDGYTALMFLATKHNGAENIGLLLERPDIRANLQNRFGRTALHLAWNSSRYSTVKDLIQHPKVDINVQDSEGTTILMSLAGGPSFLSLPSLLFERPELDVNLQDQHGYSALIIAAGTGHLEMVKLLLQRTETIINLQNHQGVTALIQAVSMSHAPIVKLLLQHPEIEVSLQNMKRKTALDMALLYKNDTMVEILEKHIQSLSIKKNTLRSYFTEKFGF